MIYLYTLVSATPLQGHIASNEHFLRAPQLGHTHRERKASYACTYTMSNTVARSPTYLNYLIPWVPTLLRNVVLHILTYITVTGGCAETLRLTNKIVHLLSSALKTRLWQMGSQLVPRKIWRQGGYTRKLYLGKTRPLHLKGPRIQCYT